MSNLISEYTLKDPKWCAKAKGEFCKIPTDCTPNCAVCKDDLKLGRPGFNPNQTFTLVVAYSR